MFLFAPVTRSPFWAEGWNGWLGGDSPNPQYNKFYDGSCVNEDELDYTKPFAKTPECSQRKSSIGLNCILVSPRSSKKSFALQSPPDPSSWLIYLFLNAVSERSVCVIPKLPCLQLGPDPGLDPVCMSSQSSCSDPDIRSDYVSVYQLPCCPGLNHTVNNGSLNSNFGGILEEYHSARTI